MNAIIGPSVRSSVLGLIIPLAALAACGREDQRAGDTAVRGDTAGGMQGMQGMGGGMMQQMQAHMRMMETDNADSLKGMLSMHRQMVANMISQFDREMRQMNMTADPAWQATVDSLRQDNIRMPEMSAAELGTFMPAHRARVMRLMEMHRSMMGGMKM